MVDEEKIKRFGLIAIKAVGGAWLLGMGIEKLGFGEWLIKLPGPIIPIVLGTVTLLVLDHFGK